MYVRLNVGTKDWDLKGTVERLRYTDDGRVVSYYIMTDTNNMTTRHRKYLKPLHPEHDPRNKENDKTIAHNPDAAIADLPIINETVPRRSARHSKVKTVRTSTYPVKSSLNIMGAELSSLEAPISVNFELKVGEEELAKVKEWWKQVDGTGNDRQGNDTRGAHNTGGAGAGNAATGGGGATRTVSNGSRQQGTHFGRVAQATATTSGGIGATRTRGAVLNMDGAEASQSGSDSTGSVRRGGKCFRSGCKVCNGRIQRMNGLITPSSSKALKRVETITMSDSEEDSETLEQMEQRLAKLLALKFKNKNSRK